MRRVACEYAVRSLSPLPRCRRLASTDHPTPPPSQVPCRYCNRTFTSETKLAFHNKWFCGPDAARSAAQSKTQIGARRRNNIDDDEEEEDSDYVDDDSDSDSDGGA